MTVRGIDLRLAVRSPFWQEGRVVRRGARSERGRVASALASGAATVIVLSWFVAACSGDDAHEIAGRSPDAAAVSAPSMVLADAGGDAGGDAGDRDDESAPRAAIPVDCQGFPLLGLSHSPGGEVLPDLCRPFHPTTNNPYAVRCIDAWPDYASGFPGDELCILPPPPGEGVQVGVHPQGSDWHTQMLAGDMSGYASAGGHFVLAPGEESTLNFRSGATNPLERDYYRTYFRMRTGSHHSIVTLHEAGAEREVWLEGQELPGLFDRSSGALQGVLGGQQRPDDNSPVTLEKPEEDAGLYLTWPATPSLVFNMHHFNVGDRDILKESWINVWWEREDAQTEINWFMGLDFAQVTSLSIPPGEARDLHYVWSIRAPTRLVRFFGHRHAWTSNFSSWIEREDGRVESIYQSFDWFDMPTYRYDSHTANPRPDAETRTDGAASGLVMLEVGEQLHFNCHVEFTDQRAVREDAPLPSEIGNLRFANEVFRGEMCIAFGNTTETDLGQPTASNVPLPDFAAR
jgi:hypothetical protein